jgi:hypothetical protein
MIRGRESVEQYNCAGVSRLLVVPILGGAILITRQDFRDRMPLEFEIFFRELCDG